VRRAADEAVLVGTGWPGAVTLAGDAATTAAVRDLATRADVLHIAAHGVHNSENPLFSYLELADGPLFGHEFQAVPRLPAHVVLSACELGLAGSRAGCEPLGMTAALLHAGARSVVAGVARIGDETAFAVGTAHHSGLHRGLSPAAALAAAISEAAEDQPAPLLCYGSGW
jgi:CHAT domain-containing protein